MLRHPHRSPGRIKEEAHQGRKGLKALAVNFFFFVTDQKRIRLLPGCPRATQKTRAQVRDHEAEHGIRGHRRSRREPRGPNAREATHLRSLPLELDEHSVAIVKVKVEDRYQGHRGQAATELDEFEGDLGTIQIGLDDLQDISDGSNGNSSDEDARVNYEERPEKVKDTKFDLSIHFILENDSDIVAIYQQESTDIESEGPSAFDDNNNRDNSGRNPRDASHLGSSLDSGLEPGLVSDYGSDHDSDAESDLDSDVASIAVSQHDLSARLDPIEATLGTKIASPVVPTSKPPLNSESYVDFTPHRNFRPGDVVYVRHRHCKGCPKGWDEGNWHRKIDKRHRGEEHYLVIYKIAEDDGQVYAIGFTCTSLGQRKEMSPDEVRDKFITLHGGKDEFLGGGPPELLLEDEARMKLETYVEKKPKSFGAKQLRDFKFEHEEDIVRHRLTTKSLERLLQRTSNTVAKSYCGRPRSRGR